ncbi:hypothetical protein BGZ98_008437 [Dissophora globulifera]|nr:hypothetical protein BGZ98_008437 [Dissophora globulifera]
MSDTEQPGSRKRPADFDELFEEGEETKATTYESEDEVVDEDGNVVGDLDLASAGTQAWLVKVPKFLAERWASVGEGVDLGKVRIFNQTNPNDPNSVPFQLLLPSDDITVNLPKTYNLQMTPNQVTNTFVFAEPTGAHPKPPHAPGYPTGKATSILATIKHECSVTPLPGSEEYRSIMRERNIEAAKKGGRSVQILGPRNNADPAGGRGGMFLPGVGIRSGFIQKKAKVQMDQKTTRMPRNELVDLLFKAFEEYQYWSFKGLVEYCKQPHSYLKEVLGEICNFIKKGPYTAKYQLKPEFAGAAAAARGQGGSGSGAGSSNGKVATNAELETTFNPAAVGVASGETATMSIADPDLQEVLDEDEDEDEDDEDLVEVEV